MKSGPPHILHSHKDRRASNASFPAASFKMRRARFSVGTPSFQAPHPQNYHPTSEEHDWHFNQDNNRNRNHSDHNEKPRLSVRHQIHIPALPDQSNNQGW